MHENENNDQTTAKTDVKKQKMPAPVKQATLRMLTEAMETLQSTVNQIKDAPEGESESDDGPMPKEFSAALMRIKDMIASVGEKYPSPKTGDKQDAKKGDDQPADQTGESDGASQEDAVSDEQLDLNKIPEEQRDTVEKIWKASEAISKRVEELSKKNDELAKVNKKLDDDLQAEVSKRVLKETEEYIATTYKNLPHTKVEKFAAVFKGMKDKAPEEMEAFEIVMKSADEAIAKGGLFNENCPQDPDTPESPYAKIEKIAAEKVAASTTGLTKAQAIAEIMKTEEGKQLVKEHRANKS